MSKSSLVEYTRISPNRTSPRSGSIDRISPHCVVGQCTIQALGAVFANAGYRASSNYGIDKDGRIGQFVDDNDRSWCTSSTANDNRALTIEVASDNTHPYAVTDKAYAALVDLCVDICQRYSKTKLLWFGDKNKTLSYNPKPDEMVITVHRWFANKACPGDYLYNRMGDLAEKVTARLNTKNQNEEENEVRYNKISEIPDYARPTIIKMVDKGLLNGGGKAKDEDGRPADLNLSADMIRVFITNDRAGLYD